MNAERGSIGGIRACVFDAYGTLFDVGSAVQRHAALLGEQAPALAALWRDRQLQYSWLRTIQGHHVDFAQITGDALDHALEALGLDAALAGVLLPAFDALDAYPEVPGVLRRLRGAGYVTAILSNGAPPMLAALLANARIDALFDAVVSVETVGVFKPHPRVYQSVVNALALRAEQICFLSSNAWDAHAASAFGLRVVWCNRRGQAPERLPGAPDARIRTLDELPELLGAHPWA